MLSNERRRYVLQVLREREDPIDLGPLAEQVAARENDTTIEDVTYAQRKRVYTALQQSHLPKMDSAGALQFDKDRGTVEFGDDLSEFDVYLEVVPETELPSSEYYLALAAVGMALSVVVALDVFPFRVVPDLAWASLLVALFGVSALVHLYTIRRTKVREHSLPGGTE